MKQAVMYYNNNLGSTQVLLEAMQKHGVKKLIFSSSTTVYGSADKMPITEETPTGVGITNPYGRTKYIIEEIIGDFCRSPDGKDWSVAGLKKIQLKISKTLFKRYPLLRSLKELFKVWMFGILQN